MTLKERGRVRHRDAPFTGRVLAAFDVRDTLAHSASYGANRGFRVAGSSGTRDPSGRRYPNVKMALRGRR